MNYTGTAKNRHEKIKNDNMSDADFETFLTSVYINSSEVMEAGASFYIFYKELGKGVFITSLEKSNLTFKQELIWLKSQLVLGGSKYQNIYEPCLFGGKDKIKTWNGGRKQTSVIDDLNLMNEIELRETIKELIHSLNTDVIRENKILKSDLHPTMKPIKLLSRFIKNSSNIGDNVLDVFGGSGSTLIACEQLNRNCFILELDEKYCDVIIERFEQFTNEKASLIL